MKRMELEELFPVVRNHVSEERQRLMLPNRPTLSEEFARWLALADQALGNIPPQENRTTRLLTN